MGADRVIEGEKIDGLLPVGGRDHVESLVF